MADNQTTANDLTNAHVGKSNSLIEASYRLSVQEQRIILAAISQVRRDEAVTDEVMYTVEVSALADLSGQAARHAYEELKAAALRLFNRKVRIEKEPDGTTRKPRVLMTGWVQSIAYIDSEGRIELRFSKDILPYINQLSGNFTLYKLKNVAQMTSAHAIRLYEMLVRWANTSNEREIDIDRFKQALQLENDYPRIFDLKKRVIQPAIDQINEHSDLWVKWGQRKTGRRVTHLQFQFGPKDPAKPKIEQKSRQPETWPTAKKKSNREAVRARLRNITDTDW